MSKRFEKSQQKKLQRDVLLKWLMSSTLVGPTNWVCFFVFTPPFHSFSSSSSLLLPNGPCFLFEICTDCGRLILFLIRFSIWIENIFL